MKGDNEEAQKRMCEAAFIDPKGAATLGLARYYLGVRALDAAEKWARLGIEVSPKAKRTAKELLGDVLCQRGKMEEARETWLESFDLSSDQTSRLEAVTRRFVTAAGKAERGGDAPAAERHLRRAAAFDLKNADVASELAAILVKTGEPDLARAWAEKALALDSSSKVAKGVLSELN
jgi:Flp pilus assembly protein TadD